MSIAFSISGPADAVRADFGDDDVEPVGGAQEIFDWLANSAEEAMRCASAAAHHAFPHTSREAAADTPRSPSRFSLAILPSNADFIECWGSAHLRLPLDKASTKQKSLP